MKRFKDPYYPARRDGKKVVIDVTNSISAGLESNAGLIDHVAKWMGERGSSRILDFGAGSLRHTLPLLKRGFQVTAVEFEQAFQSPRRRASQALEEARGHDGFTELIWPEGFLKSSRKYDVALLIYVLQTMPVKLERRIVLEAIGKRLDKNGPKRLFYASRTGEASSLPDSIRHNDGWVRGRGPNGFSFYSEMKAADTDQYFKARGFTRSGSYKGATQPFIYDYKPGAIWS